MAYTTIIFENPHTGAIKYAPAGFSWTTFFFGFFPALFRGDWKWASIQFILHLLTLGLSGLVFMFIYNKLYIRDLIWAGFKVRIDTPEVLDRLSAKLGMQIPILKNDEA